MGENYTLFQKPYPIPLHGSTPGICLDCEQSLFPRKLWERTQNCKTSKRASGTCTDVTRTSSLACLLVLRSHPRIFQGKDSLRVVWNTPNSWTWVTEISGVGGTLRSSIEGSSLLPFGIPDNLTEKVPFSYTPLVGNRYMYSFHIS